MKKFLLPSILLLVLIGFALHRLYPQNVSHQQAADSIGQTETVCGQVAGTYFASRVRGQPTFLDLDGPYPHQTVTVLIWGSDRWRFPQSPKILYYGKKICVTGMIKDYRGRPEIVVKEPGQIKYTQRHKQLTNKLDLVIPAKAGIQYFSSCSLPGPRLSSG